MSLLQQLYAARRRVALERQERFVSVLEELDRLMSAVAAPSPFDLEHDQFKSLSDKEPFRASLLGHVCVVASPYLYRMCALGTLIDFGGWKDKANKNPRSEVHAKLVQETANHAWKPLEKHCAGPISGRRGFTWWSTMDLYLADYCRAASRAGIPTDLMPPHPVILRLRLNALSGERPRVPTVVDGWDMPIFDPAKDDPVPQSGITISLETPPQLARGVDEYVVAPLPVTAIDYIALDEDEKKSCGTVRSDELWQRLIAYHA